MVSLPCCSRFPEGHAPDCYWRDDVADAALAAARAIWLRVRTEGLRDSQWGFTVLPESCADLDAVAGLRDTICERIGEDPAAAEPVQLLLRMPDVPDSWAEVQYEPHVDRTPEGGLYRRVVGALLTDAPSGTVQIDGEVHGFTAGDYYAWPGDTLHAGMINLTPFPRLTAYWRFR